jgi:oligopeptide transport system ATP-binding protein
MATVTFKGAQRWYPGADSPAVVGLDLEIGDGEFMVLVGPSGCGKSTTLRMLAGLEPVDDGSVFIGDRDVSLVPPKDRDIAMVFQNYALYPHMSVEDNMGFALRMGGMKAAERRRRVHEAARMLGLTEYLDRKPRALSGGQRQRVAIARALVMKPEIVVCDEPTSALDVSVQAQILNLLLDLREEFRLTYVVISHNLAVVEHIATQVAVMYLGRVVEFADTRTLFAQPQHPYTQALLASVPVANPKAKKLAPMIDGDVPSPINPPSGCAFHTRCRYVMDRCKVERPVLADAGARHQVACWLNEGTGRAG